MGFMNINNYPATYISCKKPLALLVNNYFPKILRNILANSESKQN